MNQTIDQRTRFRRYEDRRVAMMLAIYKTLFEEAPGVVREKKILAAIRDNFRVDRVMAMDLANPRSAEVPVRLIVGDRERDGGGETRSVGGKGFLQLMTLHDSVSGALSFERVRKPELFAADAWDSLWKEGIRPSAHALLSIRIVPTRRPLQLLWLLQLSSSREWGSRDRDLIEEVAEVLAKVADKEPSPK
jgi:hypothetical protein